MTFWSLKGFKFNGKQGKSIELSYRVAGMGGQDLDFALLVQYWCTSFQVPLYHVLSITMVGSYEKHAFHLFNSIQHNLHNAKHSQFFIFPLTIRMCNRQRLQQFAIPPPSFKVGVPILVCVLICTPKIKSVIDKKQTYVTRLLRNQSKMKAQHDPKSRQIPSPALKKFKNRCQKNSKKFKEFRHFFVEFILIHLAHSKIQYSSHSTQDYVDVCQPFIVS